MITLVLGQRHREGMHQSSSSLPLLIYYWLLHVERWALLVQCTSEKTAFTQTAIQPTPRHENVCWQSLLPAREAVVYHGELRWWWAVKFSRDTWKEGVYWVVADSFSCCSRGKFVILIFNYTHFVNGEGSNGWWDHLMFFHPIDQYTHTHTHTHIHTYMYHNHIYTHTQTHTTHTNEGEL